MECRIRSRSLTLALASVVAVGCDQAESRAAPSIVDSAGVRIVTSESGRWTPDRMWRVNPTPSVDIGAEDGDPEGYLFRVRDAVRWRESIVVINGVSDDLRVFGLDGVYRRTIGRKGGGPGEFNRLGFLRVLHDDSLLTWDFSNDRVSVFDETGTFVRSTWLERDDTFGAFVWPAALLDGDRLLTLSARHMIELGNESGRFVDSGMVAIHRLDGTLDTIVGRYAFSERMRAAHDGVITTLGAPFARELHQVRWHQGFCLGFGTTYELTCRRGLSGGSPYIVRLQVPAQPVTSSQIAAFVEEQAAHQSSYGRAFRRMADDMVFPESFPAHGEMRADGAGNLWIVDYQVPGGDAAKWRVFDSDGAYLGQLEMPEGLRVFRVYDDAVLGLWRDSLDVEHIRMHALAK